jgi:hypothetical protein
MSTANPKFAPPAILEAAMFTVYRACVEARNCTLPGFENIEKANSLMEAVHHIPAMLSDWHDERLMEMKNHFQCFYHQKWPNSPDLAATFNDRMSSNMGAGL